MIIKTKRLELIPLKIEHAKGLKKLWSDNDVIKYTYATCLKTEEECKGRITYALEKISEKDHVSNFTVLCNNEIIGTAGVPTVNYESGEYSLYYQFCKNAWGNGYGYEVAKSLVNYIFNNSNAKIIYADAVTINEASIKILRKIGMQETGIVEKEFNKDGLVLDLIHFKLEREEYFK